MLAKYESHTDLRSNQLCPFRIHIQCRSFNAVCNWHRDTEIILILEGSGNVQYGPDVLTVRSGDIVVFNANVLHRFHKNDHLVYHCIIPDASFCQENGIVTEQLLFEPHFRDTHTEALCRNVAQQYADYRSSGTPLSGAKARNAMLALLLDLWEHHAGEKGGSRPPEIPPAEMHVKKVAAYLAEHYTEPVSLDRLAALCGISKCHLSREFKRYTGLTVLTYANLIRCKHAEQCIISGMTVTETAMACGFESISYFSRTYKKHMGILPSQTK